MDRKRIYIQYLGNFELSIDDQSVELPKSKKARALFAYLAWHPKGCYRHQLANMFYADTADPKGNLRWASSRIRASLTSAELQGNADTLQFLPANCDTDLKFMTIDPSSVFSVVESNRASILSNSGFLADLELPELAEYEAWRLATQAQINRQRTLLLQSLTSENMGLIQAVEYAQHLVAVSPGLEESWALLVTALKAVGNGTEARNVFEKAKEQLEREGSLSTPLLNEAIKDIGAHTQGGSQPLQQHLERRQSLAPSVAVLSCQIGNPPTQGPGSQLIGDAIHRSASVNNGLAVIARPTAIKLSSSDDDALERARELSIDYFLSSTLMSSDKHIVCSVQLVAVDDAVEYFQWHQEFALGTNELEIAERVESFLSARFELDFPIALLGRIRDRPVAEYSASDYYHRALACIFSTEGFAPLEAERLLKQAIELQPDFGRACCALAMARTFDPKLNSDRRSLDQTISIARRAAEICQNDAFVLGWVATILTQLQRELPVGQELVNRALSINPYSIVSRVSAAIIEHYTGDDELCLWHVDQVENTSHVEPLSFLTHTCRAMCAYQQRNYQEALMWSVKAVGNNPRYIVALRYQLASLGQLKRFEEAKDLCKRIVALDPSENMAFFRQYSAYHDIKRALHMSQGLQLAGLPETAAKVEETMATI